MRYKKRINKLERCVRLGIWLVEMLKGRVSELEAENARLREAIALIGMKGEKPARQTCEDQKDGKCTVVGPEEYGCGFTDNRCCLVCEKPSYCEDPCEYARGR
ncbi:MAG: hypothetical protein A4E53_02382 [Pelotomaculum sp. PtaB.Bin104]|nr:MAG: hypothetical protein A4E53_02382 [Pelotomaculum sp. PtaB.Bin104]